MSVTAWQGKINLKRLNWILLIRSSIKINYYCVPTCVYYMKAVWHSREMKLRQRHPLPISDTKRNIMPPSGVIGKEIIQLLSTWLSSLKWVLFANISVPRQGTSQIHYVICMFLLNRVTNRQLIKKSRSSHYGSLVYLHFLAHCFCFSAC